MKNSLLIQVQKVFLVVFSLLFIRYIILWELILSRNYVADYQLAYALPLCILLGFLALSICGLFWLTKTR